MSADEQFDSDIYRDSSINKHQQANENLASPLACIKKKLPANNKLLTEIRII